MDRYASRARSLNGGVEIDRQVSIVLILPLHRSHIATPWRLRLILERVTHGAFYR